MSVLSTYLLSVVWIVFKLAVCIGGIYRFWPWRRQASEGTVQMTAQGVRVIPGGNGDFRTRLVLCLFLSGVVCLAVFGLIRPFLPPSKPQAMSEDTPSGPPPPKIARSSAAQDGDVVKIVCGSGKLCAVAATAPDAVKLDTGQAASGKVFHVKNGTKAIVTAYDPQDTRSDTAEVFVLAGADENSITFTPRSDPNTNGFIPARWMHKLQTKESVTVYQLPGKETP